MTRDDPWPLQVECGNAWGSPPPALRDLKEGHQEVRRADVTPHNLLSRTSPQGLLTVTEYSGSAASLLESKQQPYSVSTLMSGFQMGKLRHRVRRLVQGKADMNLDFLGPSVPERQGWVVGLKISSQGLRSFLGLAQADLLESHTRQL